MRFRRNRFFATTAVVLLASVAALSGCSSDKQADTTSVESVADSSADTSAETVADTEAADTVVDSAAAESTQAATDTSLTPDTTVPSAAGSDQEAGKAPFTLKGTGVDDVKFGDDLNAVKETLVAKHGEPDADSGWLEQQAPCEGMGTKYRTLTWGDLSLEFSNGPTEFGPANSEHLMAYYSADEPNGVGEVAVDGLPLLDQTIAQLKARFPEATFAMNEIAGPEYHLPGDINGSVTGLTDSDTVQTFRAGIICID